MGSKQSYENKVETDSVIPMEISTEKNVIKIKTEGSS